MVVARIKRAEPHSVAVSARTGEGIAEAIAAIEADLPRPAYEFDALVPYARGDLVDRIHKDCEIDSVEHTADGTRIVGRATEALAGELADFAVRSEEHTSELQSLMRTSYATFCLKK